MGGLRRFSTLKIAWSFAFKLTGVNGAGRFMAEMRQEKRNRQPAWRQVS
jgi:hypothetical protein